MFYIDGALKEKPVLVVDAMFGQLVGVCVRKYLHRYDATYRIRYTGAFDIAGNALPDFEFDLKTRPRKEPGTERPEHDALVLEASRETSILLKNENNALPLGSGAVVNPIGAGPQPAEKSLLRPPCRVLQRGPAPGGPHGRPAVPGP